MGYYYDKKDQFAVSEHFMKRILERGNNDSVFRKIETIQQYVSDSAKAFYELAEAVNLDDLKSVTIKNVYFKATPDINKGTAKIEVNVSFGNSDWYANEDVECPIAEMEEYAGRMLVRSILSRHWLGEYEIPGEDELDKFDFKGDPGIKLSERIDETGWASRFFKEHFKNGWTHYEKSNSIRYEIANRIEAMRSLRVLSFGMNNVQASVHVAFDDSENPSICLTDVWSTSSFGSKTRLFTEGTQIALGHVNDDIDTIWERLSLRLADMWVGGELQNVAALDAKKTSEIENVFLTGKHEKEDEPAVRRETGL